MKQCEYINCDNPASHVLVDYGHNILGSGHFFCSQHAFDSGRERCPCCSDYQVEDDDGKTFLPTYQQGELDESGCCSEHP